MDEIGRYLEALASHLPRTVAADAFLAEVEDHLRESAGSYGSSEGAMREAIARFGDVAYVADAFVDYGTTTEEGGMFERMTEAARRVVVKGQEEARTLRHSYIGTEHLLLGMLGEQTSTAWQSLRERGVSVERARAEIEALVGRGDEEPATRHIPFTPRAKKVLELGLREALQLGANVIEPGHILLGLLREGEGVAAQTLARCGVERAQLRHALLRRMALASPMRPYGPSLTTEMHELDVRLAYVRAAKDSAIEAQNWDQARRLREQERELLLERAREGSVQFERLFQQGGPAETATAPVRPDVALVDAGLDTIRQAFAELSHRVEALETRMRRVERTGESAGSAS
jgi:hypothetical protein